MRSGKQKHYNVKKRSIEHTSLRIPKFFWIIAIAIFIVGFLSGLIIVKIEKSPAKKTQVSSENKLHQTSQTGYQFLNPSLFPGSHQEVRHDRLNDFSDKINNYCNNALKNKNIESISYYFRDLTNGFTIKYNDDEKFIPASLTKVPLLVAIFYKAEKDPKFLDKQVKYTITEAESYISKHPEMGHQMSSLINGNYYSISDLCHYMIGKSDNEATLLLFNEVGKDLMVDINTKLGFTDLLGKDASSNIITVKTYSHFFRILYNASFLSPAYSNKALEILSHADYQEGIRKAVPSDITVCHKFGERDTFTSPTTIEIRQLHHAGIVYYPGKNYFICIMTKGNNKKQLQDIIYQLSLITYEEVDRQVKLMRNSGYEKDIID